LQERRKAEREEARRVKELEEKKKLKEEK